MVVAAKSHVSSPLRVILGISRIVEITNQYLEYINEMKRHDLNIVSEFLVMAATLLGAESSADNYMAIAKAKVPCVIFGK